MFAQFNFPFIDFKTEDDMVYFDVPLDAVDHNMAMFETARLLMRVVPLTKTPHPSPKSSLKASPKASPKTNKTKSDSAKTKKPSCSKLTKSKCVGDCHWEVGIGCKPGKALTATNTNANANANTKVVAIFSKKEKNDLVKNVFLRDITLSKEYEHTLDVFLYKCTKFILRNVKPNQTADSPDIVDSFKQRSFGDIGTFFISAITKNIGKKLESDVNLQPTISLIEKEFHITLTRAGAAALIIGLDYLMNEVLELSLNVHTDRRIKTKKLQQYTFDTVIKNDKELNAVYKSVM